ncbi:hypothetical protein EON83_30625 [bacterium]|nr:MAG: hypothetical protein EON83_30625 [bacterium]
MPCLEKYSALVSCLAAITPVITAVIVAYIAYQQFKTNKQKLRLDLYNKRFNVYDKTLAFYAALHNANASFKNEDFMKVANAFTPAFNESKFLFHPKHGVHQLLNEFHEAAIGIIGFNSDGKALADSGAHEEFSKLFQKNQHELLVVMPKRIKQIEEAMASYLNFHKVAA